MVTKRIIVLSIVTSIIVISCTSPNNRGLKIPNDSLINSVIRRVIDLDSIGREVPISIQLCPYTLDYSIDENRIEDIPPPPPNNSTINPISPKYLWSFIKEKIDTTLDLQDTSFLLNQILASKGKFLNIHFLKPHNLIEIKYKSFKDYFRTDSIVVFYYPIFTSDIKYVYVNYHYKLSGYGLILKNVGGVWNRITEFDTGNP